MSSRLFFSAHEGDRLGLPVPVARSQALQFGICRAGCFELLVHDADYEIMGNIYENPELLL
jgi:hypothetical protein